MNNKTHMKYAEIELKHIQLELQNNRFQHLRHFVDQYYCYRKGFVNGNDRADWEAIVWNGRVSVEARECKDRILAQGKPHKIALKEARKLVVKEHVVPLKVITNLLKDLVTTGDTTLESIADILHTYTVFGTITKDEDAELRKAGLNSKMPKDDAGNKWDGDVFARYKAVGIELED